MAFINELDNGTAERFRPSATGPTRTVTPAVETPAIPPASTAPGDITVGGGSTPDWGALLRGDAGLLAAQNTGLEQRTAAGATRQAALRRLAIQYGGLPAGFTDQFGDIDATTLDMAGKNAYSQKAVIQRNYDQGIEGFKRALAARGLLQSGELAHGLDQADTARGQQEYDAGNQFGDQFVSAVNGYTGAVNDTHNAEAQAVANAETNVYNNPANRPVGSAVAHMDQGSVEKYGFPIYTDPASGKKYKIDGSEWVDPGAPPTSNMTTPTPMNAAGNSAPVQQAPYAPSPTDANGVPISAGFYGFDANGRWIG